MVVGDGKGYGDVVNISVLIRRCHFPQPGSKDKAVYSRIVTDTFRVQIYSF